MSIIFFLAAAIAALIGAVHTAIYGPRAKARKRLREASRELVDGAVVTLTGTIAAVETLEAPLSGRTVVAFASNARIYEGVGKHRRLVEEVFEVESKDFILETKDGLIHVESTKPALALPAEPLIPRKIELEQRYLVERGKTAHARDAGFDEIVITAGMKVSVHGAVRFEAVPGEATYRETGKKIILSAPPGHPLTIGRPL